MTTKKSSCCAGAAATRPAHASRRGGPADRRRPAGRTSAKLGAFILGALTAVTLGVAGAPSATAADLPPTLMGEQLNDPTPTLTVDCHPDGTSTISFEAEGVATGPYPGSFTETGTATIGPQPLDPDGFNRRGPLIDFEATFAIDSSVGQVVGTKKFTGYTDPGTQVAVGQCYSTTPNGVGYFRTAIARYTVGYEATITTGDGRFVDRGVVPLFATQYQTNDRNEVTFQEFIENFESQLDAVEPGNSPGHATGGGQIAGDVTFGFTAKNDGKGPKGNCNVNDRARRVKVGCTSVTSYGQSGNQARFGGSATVNGTPTTYEIVVQDNGEPGAGNDQFSITTAGGYSAGGPLTQGNVQVHK